MAHFKYTQPLAGKMYVFLQQFASTYSFLYKAFTVDGEVKDKY